MTDEDVWQKEDPLPVCISCGKGALRFSDNQICYKCANQRDSLKVELQELYHKARSVRSKLARGVLARIRKGGFG